MPLRTFFRRLFRSSDAQGQAGRRGDAARPDQASGVPLRCRPGDLAMVVRGPSVNIGVLLRVLESDPRDATWTFKDASRPLQMWILGTPSGAFRSTFEAPGRNAWVTDATLRPIRDPGEDAVDEILQKVGLPTFALERQEA